MITFLGPLVEQLNHLHDTGKCIKFISKWYVPSYPLTGVEVRLPSGEVQLSHSVLLLCSVDLPAKAAVCNMLQYNGLRSCPTCLEPGDNSITPAPMLCVRPYCPSSMPRTDQSVFTAVRDAVLENKVVRPYI